MRFSPTRFNRHLANLGQDFTWRRAWSCACVTSSSGGADPRCPHCQGKAYIWVEPVAVKAASANQKTQSIWGAMGIYMAGDIVITVPENSALWDAGKYDRVTMLNGSNRFSMRMVRGAPTERLLFKPESFERVFWFDDQKRIVDGTVPEIDPDGRLIWGAGAPPAGASYSLTGRSRPEYFLFAELPGNRNMHYGARLPKLMVLRQFDLLGR